MGFFNNFPYTNFHDFNLDWILNKIKDLENTVENREWPDKDYGFLSNAEGATAYEKLVSAMQNSDGVILDMDVDAVNIQMVKNGFTIYGNGHKIKWSGVLSGGFQYAQNFKFIGVKFDGSAGGYFASNYNFLRPTFIACEFVGFSHDVFVGDSQQANFIGCFFNNNSSYIINMNRVDAMNFENCFIENGNNSFLKISEVYGLVVRDTTIEGLQGTAIELPSIYSGCLFSGLYLEDNHENFVVRKEYCFDLTIENCIVNNLTQPNNYLIRIFSNYDGEQHGTIRIVGCKLGNGAIAKIANNISKLNFDQHDNSQYTDEFVGVPLGTATVTSNTVKATITSVGGTGTTIDYPLTTIVGSLHVHTPVGVSVISVTKNEVPVEDINASIVYFKDMNTIRFHGSASDTYVWLISYYYR